jgi:hypothetical protein
MDATKRKALEAAEWRLGDAADFLGMSDEERQLLDCSDRPPKRACRIELMGVQWVHNSEVSDVEKPISRLHQGQPPKHSGGC